MFRLINKKWRIVTNQPELEDKPKEHKSLAQKLRLSSLLQQQDGEDTSVLFKVEYEGKHVARLQVDPSKPVSDALQLILQELKIPETEKENYQLVIRKKSLKSSMTKMHMYKKKKMDKDTMIYTYKIRSRKVNGETTNHCI